jgi:2-hydroxymuconate-semialdehyde hydrolase
LDKTAALQHLINAIGAPVDQETVSAARLQTAYLTAGSGEPVLLLHGASSVGITWYPVIGPLSGHFCVIAPDIIGYGESDKPSAPYDLSYYCAWLAGFLDALGVQRAHVVGHSQGGAIALQFVLDHPARVDRLVLVDSAALGGGAPLRVVFAMLCYSLFPSPTTGLWLTRYLVHNVQSIDPALGDYMNQVTEVPGGWRTLLKTRTHSGIPPQQLGKIAQQTLIIWGEDDRLFGLDHAKAAARAMPHARLHVLPQAGHAAFFDQPQQFNDMLLDFLRGDSAVSAGGTQEKR